MKITTTLFLLIVSALNSFSQALYAPNQITLVEITFTQNNWDQLLDNLYAAGNGDRLIASVEINGEAFDSVGVRYRGGSTYDPANTKNPFNIKLDHVKNQDYEGYDVLKLSNGAKDPSWLREVMTFEIAQKYMEAPQANFASVYVNGNFHGLYTNVESINSKFFEERFLSDADNTRFEANPTYSFDDLPTTAPFGCTLGHGSSLEFLGNGIICYFDHYEIQSTTGWEALRDMTSLLKNTPQNARNLLDLDRFMWYSALNSLLVNLDSYTGAGSRNFFLGVADNGHWVIAPDDMNESFGRFPWATVPASGDPQPGLSFYTDFNPYFGTGNTEKPLLSAIFGNPTWKKMYTAHLRTMMNEMLISGYFEQRAGELQSLINDEVVSDDNHFYTHDQFLQNLNNKVIDPYDGEDAYGLIELLAGRVAYLQGLPEFMATPPAISNIAAVPAMPSPGTSVTLKAAVANGNMVWLGHRNSIKDVFELSQMFDDGAHGDGAAGDGVFGTNVTIQVGGLQYYIYAENAQAGMFSPQRAEYEFYNLAATGSVVINEVMAANESTVADQNGEFDDWAEFVNNTNATINLSGWHFTDDPLVLDKWTFPAGTFLDPGTHLTVWVDDDELQAGLHTTFNLSAAGEELLLVMPDMTVADQVVFGPQTPDVSFARCPDGTGAFIAADPTFGAVNNPGCTVDAVEVVDREALKIYPNPASDVVFVETEMPGAFQGELRKATGQVVRRFLLNGQAAVAVGDLPTGIYFIRLENGEMGKVLVLR